MSRPASVASAPAMPVLSSNRSGGGSAGAGVTAGLGGGSSGTARVATGASTGSPINASTGAGSRTYYQVISAPVDADGAIAYRPPMAAEFVSAMVLDAAGPACN